MLDDIEKSYRKNLSEKRFWRFYTWRAIMLTGLALVLIYGFYWDVRLVAAVLGFLLFAFIIFFFWREIHRTIDKTKGYTQPRALPRGSASRVIG